MDIKDLGLGFCLGDSLDVNSHFGEVIHDENWESAWGNKRITKELIRSIKSKGFKTIKLPISWNEHFVFDESKNEWVMEEWFMNRVKEVIRYVLDENMFCIINTQHDRDFLVDVYAEQDSQKQIIEYFVHLWSYIATECKDFSDMLLYESCNELGYDQMNSDLRDFFNLLNRRFLEVVRDAEGNDNRMLLLEGYFSDVESTFMYYCDVKDDQNHAIAVHFYTPWTFAIQDATGVNSPSEVARFDDGEVDGVLSFLSILKMKFQREIVLSEVGCNRQGRKDEDVCAWIEKVLDYAKNNGIPVMLWNDGKAAKELIDRETMEERVPGIYKVFKQYF